MPGRRGGELVQLSAHGWVPCLQSADRGSLHHIVQQASLEFYTQRLGMTHIDTYHFDAMGFSLYFLQSFDADAAPEPAAVGTPGSDAAHAHLWSTRGSVLELTHNHGDDGAR